MEASASAPTHPEIELEPPEWQPRAMWVGARQLCGAAAFFFMAFVFAYFYLRSLDTHKDWKIGSVNAPIGFGVAIVVALLLSAVALRIAATQSERRVRGRGRRARARAPGRRAAGDRVDDAGLRPVKRGLRQRIRRVDRLLLGVRPRLRVLDRDAGRDRLAAPS